tara:strand:- start:54 stop:284 length:231 start_codon:yes stop_codon:yes gene_type:complete
MVTYEVHAENIGTVYTGIDIDEATSTYQTYVQMSEDGYGRVAGETVTLMADDDIVTQHVGSTRCFFCGGQTPEPGK